MDSTVLGVRTKLSATFQGDEGDEGPLLVPFPLDPVEDGPGAVVVTEKDTDCDEGAATGSLDVLDPLDPSEPSSPEPSPGPFPDPMPVSPEPAFVQYIFACCRRT